MRMLASLDKLVSAEHVDDVWKYHVDSMAGFGFDRLIYGYTRFRTTQRPIGDWQDSVVLSNHSQAYLDEFLGNNMVYSAPMTKWAAENVGVRSWRFMFDDPGSLSDEERRVLEFNRSMGVTAGYTIAFPDSLARAKGAIALTAKPGLSQDDVDAIWDEHGRELVVLNNVAHLKLINLPHPSKRSLLTKRQREALEWVADGKTTADIALILEVAPATVEKHLRLARDALDVDTTAQAILKATFLNQIFVSKL
nr:LuxR family transcriptional regulator [Candidatus Halocynthiibacter alkanivorans]